MTEQEDLEKVMSMARKLKELSERGVDGEKEAAETKYKAYLIKHDLNDSDINPEMNKRIFVAKDSEYKDVLLNVILSINPYTRHNDTQTAIECYLDQEDYAEVVKKYEYFSKLLSVEKELLITAFLSKHKDFFEPDAQAKKKWRERRVENSALTIKEQEAKIIRQEMNRQKADTVLGVDVETKVIDSGDRLKVAAFNLDRAGRLMQILLDGKYVRYRTKIEK